MFPKLSVALTVNIDVTFEVTIVGVPEIIPKELIISPLGRDPLINVYVMVIAGATALALNGKSASSDAGKLPIDPAGVFQTGCAILVCA
jgi:hypothetical protein